MKSWHKDKIICRTSSRHNHLLEVAIEDGRTVLNTENGNYSYGNLHIIFDDVFRQEHIAEKQFSNILLLGMGAGSVIELLRTDFGQKNKITAIEIDEEIISLARQHFNLNSYQQLEVIHADAYDFVLNNTEIYDLIIIDLYIDLEVPTKFETEDFVKLLMKITSKGS
ncbi:MAG: fused MFS/spermidine synthase, partial [Bacteroidetes bacterium]|nr:fused MFS/spermidine synthase [Bacteroidota bacterium]